MFEELAYICFSAVIINCFCGYSSFILVVIALSFCIGFFSGRALLPPLGNTATSLSRSRHVVTTIRVTFGNNNSLHLTTTNAHTSRQYTHYHSLSHTQMSEILKICQNKRQAFP